jgi:hypothetical protein
MLTDRKGSTSADPGDAGECSVFPIADLPGQHRERPGIAMGGRSIQRRFPSYGDGIDGRVIVPA